MLKGICQKEGNIFVKKRVIYLLKGFVKRRVICLLKGICQKEGNIFVKKRVIYLLKGICQKEGNMFVKRYLSKGG